MTPALPIAAAAGVYREINLYLLNMICRDESSAGEGGGSGRAGEGGTTGSGSSRGGSGQAGMAAGQAGKD